MQAFLLVLFVAFSAIQAQDIGGPWCPPITAEFKAAIMEDNATAIDLLRTMADISMYPDLQRVFEETNDIFAIICRFSGQFAGDRLWAMATPELQDACYPHFVLFTNAMYRASITLWQMLYTVCADENGGSYPATGSVSVTGCDNGPIPLSVVSAAAPTIPAYPVCIPTEYTCDQTGQSYILKDVMFDFYDCLLKYAC